MPIGERAMTNLKTSLACGIAAIGLASPSYAFAQQRDFDVPAMPASRAVQAFARQAGINLIASGEILRGITTNPVKGKVEVQDALDQMLLGTQLKATRTN
jgi:iron complex outermembrane receptor protein